MNKAVFKDERLSALFYPQRIRVVQALIKLQRDIEKGNYKDLPAPYLSLIAKEARIHKRSALLALQKLEDENIVAHEYVPYFVRGRLTKIRIYIHD